ncbi:hypothetical protein HDU78_002993 [Chytriomyces hyalinus]|nr:hypothetical protein HDU78_002993 [Chytriomyces hyalinus]
MTVQTPPTVIDSLTRTNQALLRRVVPTAGEGSDVPVLWSRRTLAACGIAFILGIVYEVWFQRFLVSSRLQLYQESAAFTINYTLTILYHAVFFLIMSHWMYLVWDAVMTFNTLQVLSINLINFGAFISAILNVQQFEADKEDLARVLKSDPVMLAYLESSEYRVLRIAPALLAGCFLPLFAFFSVKLKADFGWRRYRIAGGDKAVERVFMWYHLFLLAQKYSFLFSVCLSIVNVYLQLVVGAGFPTISVIAVLLSPFLPFLGHRAVRREMRALGCAVVLVYAALFAVQIYTVYFSIQSWERVTRIPSVANTYEHMLNTLLLLGVASETLLLGAGVSGGFCIWHFGSGLKEALDEDVVRMGVLRQFPEGDLDA